MKDLALIEIHDAKLSALVYHAGGAVSLSFESLNVFVQEAPERFGVWSFQAELLLDGVERVSIDKRIDGCDYVSDGDILDTRGNQIELKSALNWMNARMIRFVFSSSAVLEVQAARVRISLQERIKKLETWEGPLVSGEP